METDYQSIIGFFLIGMITITWFVILVTLVQDKMVRDYRQQCEELEGTHGYFNTKLWDVFKYEMCAAKTPEEKQLDQARMLSRSNMRQARQARPMNFHSSNARA